VPTAIVRRRTENTLNLNRRVRVMALSLSRTTILALVLCGEFLHDRLPPSVLVGDVSDCFARAQPKNWIETRFDEPALELHIMHDVLSHAVNLHQDIVRRSGRSERRVEGLGDHTRKADFHRGGDIWS